MAALSTLKRRAKALTQVLSSREIRSVRLCYCDVAVGLIAQFTFEEEGGVRFFVLHLEHMTSWKLCSFHVGEVNN